MLCNSEVLRRKGCSTVDEIIGKTDRDFYPDDVAEQVYEAEQQLMSGGRPIVNQERWVMDQASGARTWNLTTKVPLTDEQGEIVGLVGIGRDITDRKRAEEAYRTLVDHSLIKPRSGPTGPMLSMLETIRWFALQALVESGREDEVRARHLARRPLETPWLHSGACALLRH